jgi:hypothetical protein
MERRRGNLATPNFAKVRWAGRAKILTAKYTKYPPSLPPSLRFGAASRSYGAASTNPESFRGEMLFRQNFCSWNRNIRVARVFRGLTVSTLQLFNASTSRSELSRAFNRIEHKEHKD